MWQLYQDPVTNCSVDHRMEQRGTLFIINSPLVVLSTGPMHILKKYPVNMLCIGLVRRLDKTNQHPRHWRELISQHLHTATSKSAQLLGDQKTNFGHHTEYAAQTLPRCFKKKKKLHFMSGDSPKGTTSNLSYQDSGTHDTSVLFFIKQSTLSVTELGICLVSL